MTSGARSRSPAASSARRAGQSPLRPQRFSVATRNGGLEEEPHDQEADDQRERDAPDRAAVRERHEPRPDPLEHRGAGVPALRVEIGAADRAPGRKRLDTLAAVRAARPVPHERPPPNRRLIRSHSTEKTTENPLTGAAAGAGVCPAPTPPRSPPRSLCPGRRRAGGGGAWGAGAGGGCSPPRPPPPARRPPPSPRRRWAPPARAPPPGATTGRSRSPASAD